MPRWQGHSHNHHMQPELQYIFLHPMISDQIDQCIRIPDRFHLPQHWELVDQNEVGKYKSLLSKISPPFEKMEWLGVEITH
jgi:hypothetical protein